MIEKALNQSEPKLISEFFLSEDEKGFIRGCIIDSINRQPIKVFQIIMAEKSIEISKKIGLGKGFIEEIKSRYLK